MQPIQATDEKMNRLLLALLVALFVASATAFSPTHPSAPTFSRSTLETQRNAIWDTVGSMYRNWGKKATASHILFRPSQFPEEKAKEKLLKIKAEIGNDPEKFAAAAREWRWDCVGLFLSHLSFYNNCLSKSHKNLNSCFIPSDEPLLLDIKHWVCLCVRNQLNLLAWSNQWLPELEKWWRPRWIRTRNDGQEFRRCLLQRSCWCRTRTGFHSIRWAPYLDYKTYWGVSMYEMSYKPSRSYFLGGWDSKSSIAC